MSDNPERKPVKCVVWDLDDTLWRGILVEDPGVELRPGVLDVVKSLDARGVVQSIASRNDHDGAMERLEQLGISEYFLWPQINWAAKSEAIKKIASHINISTDAIVFVDDQPFERDEVASSLPSVRAFDAAVATDLLELLDLTHAPVTNESRSRRAMYQAEHVRKRAEESFTGSDEAFLATLEMVITVAAAEEADLERAEELTVRTNQLNSTGHTYSRAELAALRESANHRLVIVGLDDKYGTYGRIGLVLIELGTTEWTLRLLLMSCRVMSRGVGGVVLHHVMREAKAAGVHLKAEFVRTERNRIMYVTYRFAGFGEIARDGDNIMLEHDLASIPDVPPYLRLVVS